MGGEALHSRLWTLVSLALYARLSKWMQPELRGRVRREVARGEVCVTGDSSGGWWGDFGFLRGVHLWRVAEVTRGNYIPEGTIKLLPS